MAHYTQLTPDNLNNLLGNYDLGVVVKVTPLDGGQANSSWKVSTRKNDFTLVICDEKDEKSIANLTDILNYLEEQHVPTTRLIKTRKGNQFLAHNGKPVYLKSYLQGEVIRELTPAMIQQVGRAIAQLHALPPISALNQSYPSGLEAFNDLLKEDHKHQYIPWLLNKRTYLQRAINPDLPKSFIHGDIFWDNLLFKKDALVAILDFEEACLYYTLFDIGMAAVGCCAKNGGFNFSLIEELLHGYQSVTPFSPLEKSQLPIFIEYAAVAASFWRFQHYNIKHPTQKFADSYLELSSLADQIHTFSDTLMN